MITRRALSAALVLATLAGCKMGPNYKQPEIALPAEFPAIGGSMFDGDPVSPEAWWTVFNDPTLTALVERAYRQNLTLEAAGLRVIGARLARRTSTMLFFPVDQESGSISHVNFSQNVDPDVEIDPVERGRIGEMIAANVRLPDVQVTDSIDLYDVGIDGLWEPDLWGRVRRLVEAKTAFLEALEGDYDSILVSLTGEVAATYIQIRTLEHRAAVAEDNVVALQMALDSAEDRADSGQASPSDAHLLRSLLRDTQASIPAYRAARQQSIAALCLLLGEAPNDLAEILGEGGPIPTASAGVALGVPADLLRRRPDVRAAERRAHAESANIGVIQAGMMPSFKVFGGIGLRSSHSDSWFENSSIRGTYGAGLSWSLLLLPVYQNLARIQDTQFRAAVLQYHETVLRAAAEVESAANRLAAAEEQVPLLETSASEAQRAVETSLSDYRGGDSDAASLVLGLQSTVTQRDRLVETQGEMALALVATYKALGGGWELREGNEVIDRETYDQLRSDINWSILNRGIVDFPPSEPE